VWIANYRATKFSYGHINYTSNDKVIIKCTLIDSCLDH
jgi:hypothetical protein